MKSKNGRKWVLVLGLFAIATSGKEQVMSGSSHLGEAEMAGDAVQTRRTRILPLLAGAWSGVEVQGKMKTSLDAKKPAVDSPEIGKALLQGSAPIDGSLAPVSDGCVPGLLLAATSAKGKLNPAFPDSAGAFRIVAPKRGAEQAAPSR